MPMRYYVRNLPALLLLACLLASHPAGAYSLLTHEQLIDLTWQGSITPLLRSRYPKVTAEELEQARSYAYAGCMVQDIGYYPFGDPFFSDLTHYVRSGDFVVHLIRDAKNVNELAFAVGALSHYIGDNIGHAQATNRAVALEFPKLAAKYGPSVSYGEGERAHVQTEFAFDINEIAHDRLAPSHYLHHVGLNIPVKQLADAFYNTYGMSENFPGKRSLRVNVKGFRFAVRSFIPSVAYAVTLLQRKRMPVESMTPDLKKLDREVARVAAENHWDRYRSKPGIGTHSLAALIYVLPKLGPLRALQIKGPTATTEAEYVHSVIQSTDALSAALKRLGTAHQTLANRDLDTGLPVREGSYPLADDTYAKLLERLVGDPKHTVPPGLKSDIQNFYSNPAAPSHTKQKPKKWAKVQSELETLKTMPVSSQPLATETQ